MNEVPETIPWWQSNVLRALIASGLSQIVVILRSHGVINFEPDVNLWVEVGFQAIALGAAIYAFWSRSRQPSPPVTLRREPP
jgi:hypothetical protein